MAEMKTYEVTYVDTRGKKFDTLVEASSPREAFNEVEEWEHVTRVTKVEEV